MAPGAFVRVTGIISLFAGINLFLVEGIERFHRGISSLPTSSSPREPGRPQAGKARAPSTPKLIRKIPPMPAPRAPGPTTPPSVLYKVEPEYSPEAREARFQGTVHVSLVVGEDGKARDIVILDSPGLGLNEKVIEVLGRWRFKPATRDGVPVPQKATINIDFRLM